MPYVSPLGHTLTLIYVSLLGHTLFVSFRLRQEFLEVIRDPFLDVADPQQNRQVHPGGRKEQGRERAVEHLIVRVNGADTLKR